MRNALLLFLVLWLAIPLYAQATEPAEPRHLEMVAFVEGPYQDNHAEEQAVYVVEGNVKIAGCRVDKGQMAVLAKDGSREIFAESSCRIMVIGGETMSHRHLWWNFVSTSEDRMEKAKQDWLHERFDKVPGETEFIPLPER